MRFSTLRRLRQGLLRILDPLWSFYILLRFSARPRTICGAGAFACQLVMFYRRRLPHWHPDLTEATFLFVTWRLAGSIPRACLPQPATGAPLSAGRAFLVLDREVDKAAFGPVWLRDARVASVVANALLYGEHGRNFYQLRAWVIMPNHVHVLLLPKTSLPVIMRWLKGSTARQANLVLGRTGEAFWQDESFDHRVRDEAELDRLVHYVEHNPVSAGLAANPHDWHWSSARLAGESACPTIGACLREM
jgi:putative transposase